MTEPRYCTFKYKTGSICGRKLADLNKGTECYSHSYPTEEEDMREQGTCTNCKRGPMAVQKRGEHGKLCASCGAAIAGLGGADAVAALFEAAKKFEGKPVMKMSPKKSSSDPKPQDPPKPREKAVATPPLDPIISTLLSSLTEHITQARGIYNALLVLREHGAQFDFPEVELP